MPDGAGDERADDGDWRPSKLSIAAGALVVVVAVVLGGVLLANSDIDINRLIGTEDRHPLDLVLVGDSFADQSRAAFLDLAERRELTAEVYAYGGTSLCGWEEELHRLAEREPDVLILSFAGNDMQDCMNPTGQPRDPEAVAADYRRDLSEVVELFRPTGTDLYVVEPPPIRDAPFEANAAAMREMYRDASIDHPRITVIKSKRRLGPDSAFHAALPCEEGDQDCRQDGTVVLRQGDGIHLTPAGGRRYARAIFDTLARGR